MGKEFKFNEVAVGCDIEGFWLNSKGKPVSVEGLLGGVKGHPLPCDGGGYLEDCVAFEINPDPVPVSVGSKGFVTNIRKCISAVDVKARELNFTTSLTPVQLFTSTQLTSEQAKLSGCSASYDAWELERLPTIDLEGTNHRFASGDIHVSWPGADEYPYFRVNVARWLDIMIGLSEVVYTRSNKRKEFYGKAGTHRPTVYGVEYKSASNFWLADDAKIAWVYNRAVEAVDRATRDNERGEELSLENFKVHARQCRQRWDKNVSKAILDELCIPTFPA